jgi:hypothetical protein
LCRDETGARMADGSLQPPAEEAGVKIPAGVDWVRNWLIPRWHLLCPFG